MLEYDFTYDQLYEMTISEMIDTLTARRKGMAYRIWKEAHLIAWAVMGKGYPKTPEMASPELYPAKQRIKMPPNLLKAQNEKRGGKIIYE